MTEKVGVLVPAFGLREVEPNPCNIKLAEEALRQANSLMDRKKHCEVVLVVQWEVERALKKLKHLDDDGLVKFYLARQWRTISSLHVVHQRADGQYLDTREVVDEAIKIFRAEGCTRMYIVANPFLHQQQAYALALGKGMKVRLRPTKWIGFDTQSTQWWCRSWHQFLWQAIRLMTGKKHGHNGRQVPTT